MMWLW